MAPRKKPDPLPVLLSRGDLIRPDELAASMKVAQGTVYLWVERGIIPFLRIGKCIRFYPEDVGEWLKAKRQAATKAPGGGPVQAAT